MSKTLFKAQVYFWERVCGDERINILYSGRKWTMKKK